jgi:hypothetical protein
MADAIMEQIEDIQMQMEKHSSQLPTTIAGVYSEE